MVLILSPLHGKTYAIVLNIGNVFYIKASRLVAMLSITQQPRGHGIKRIRRGPFTVMEAVFDFCPVDTPR